MPDAADIEALWPAAQALQGLGVEFYIGGSVASNIYGPWRATMDSDLVAVVREEHVVPLVTRLSEAYYIEPTMVRDAIRAQSSFNIIHNDTAQKIDVFIARRRPYDLAARQRTQVRSLTGDGRFQLPVASPEDVVLSKLEWYRLGDEMSERQWSDIMGVMKVQAPNLDRAYLDRWAKDLGVNDLLERAWREARV